MGLEHSSMCFYHSRRDAQAKEYNNALEWLHDNEGELLMEEILEVDCLGMTALHVLACSGINISVISVRTLSENGVKYSQPNI